ncbi:MAG: helix-turn-helix domain-containing protein [Pirellulaceae bacterium]|jgi:excisionase family DNA binding protein|nr:helix-turn-helix domain-containing protein [Pirellulaceae bacterium]MDP6719963.1 helix-turn-helix domain-containing protein [Pirellulaceae bacterium]
MPPTKRKLTPPEIARLWGITSDKVLAWIRSGELRAIDASTKCGDRPRYLIDVDDLAAFERSRSNVATPPAKPAKRRRDVPQYV